MWAEFKTQCRAQEAQVLGVLPLIHCLLTHYNRGSQPMGPDSLQVRYLHYDS